MVKRKMLCVCTVISELGILYGSRLEGEIFFKHSLKCKHKTQGAYEWTGAGYQRRDNAD